MLRAFASMLLKGPFSPQIAVKEMEPMKDMKPKNHAEEVALFRSQIVGALTRMQLDRGALAGELRRLAAERYRAPASEHTHKYSVTTLERWYYAYKHRGLAGLVPLPRKDQGTTKAINDATKDLIVDIRREHPSASVSLILRTLTADGRINQGQVSESALRRLLVRHGLDRVPSRDGKGARTRLRWSAERPGALWHGDVCHLSPILVDGKPRPVRIHALLDDCSRYIVALEAHFQEREEDMLRVFVNALRRHGAPDGLYLDNGSTYRGDILLVACGRLGVTLKHARPYDPEARGKMERFWRTLREGCLDFLGEVASLHDVNARLLAFLDVHYHKTPHSSLFGKSPATVFSAHPRAPDDLDEQKLRDALTVRERRRVRKDTTISVGGKDFELSEGWLAGRMVQIGRSLINDVDLPWVEYDGKTYPVHAVDEKGNADGKRRRRRPRENRPARSVRFDPAGALLDKAVGRRRRDDDKDGGA